MTLEVFRGRGLPPNARGGALAMGDFDGMHKGHSRVIAEAAAAARRLGAPLTVVTFDPHPRRWFNPAAQPFGLTTSGQIERLLGEHQVQRFYILPFDQVTADLSDDTFAREVLVSELGARFVATCFDYRFDRGRSSDPGALRHYGDILGFEVSIVEPVTDEGGRECSASAARQALRDGNMARATALLGRAFAVEGIVVHGDQLGRTIGFPTANIRLRDYVRPAFGIYACRTRLPDGREIPSVGYIGRRPTVADGTDERLEVHLFDFNESIYGQLLEVDLIGLVRGDKKFETLDAMVEQMEVDAVDARRFLGSHPKSI